MQYMLAIYNNADAIAAFSEEERNAIFSDVDALMAELKESGEWVGGAGLAHPSTTKVVTVRDGVVTTTDGPYAEAKEVFAGFLTVETETEERAVEIASRWPDAKYWRMEVRALMTGGGEEM